MRARCVNVSVPEELAKEIDKFIEKSKYGYRSRTEVVVETARRLLDKKS